MPGGLPPPPEAYRGISRPHVGLSDRINAALDNLDVDDVDALVKTGTANPPVDCRYAIPAQLEAEIKTAYEKITAEGEAALRCVHRPPLRICRTHRSRDSRNPSEHPRLREYPARHQGGVCLALQRPGDRLPGAKEGFACGRRAVCRVQRMVRSDIGARA